MCMEACAYSLCVCVWLGVGVGVRVSVTSQAQMFSTALDLASSSPCSQ